MAFSLLFHLVDRLLHTLHSQGEHQLTVTQQIFPCTHSYQFLNRIDEVIIFNNLEKNHIREIVDIELTNVIKRENDIGYNLEVKSNAKDFLTNKGYDKKYGARPLKRAIQKYVEDLLAEEIVKTQLNLGDTIKIDWDGKSKSLVSLKKK